MHTGTLPFGGLPASERWSWPCMNLSCASGIQVSIHFCRPSPQAADVISAFFERCSREPQYWEKISKGGLERIYSR